MTEIRGVAIQIARPAGPDDPGMAEYANYIVADGMVTLVDEAGKPLLRTGGTLSARSSTSAPTRWERKLRPDEDPRQAAKELLWAKYRAGKKGSSDFNRPLNLPRMSVA